MIQLKAQWLTLLREIRRQEIETVFGRCPSGTFRNLLELGAGDGFQSQLMTRYARRVIATDVNPGRLGTARSRDVQRVVCDAESIGNCFAAGVFDVVFSSNLLEHLPNPGGALRGLRRVMTEGGISIHIVPNPFWKACHVMLHHPNRILSSMDRRLRAGVVDSAPGTGSAMGNNPKRSPHPIRSAWWPAPHGISEGHVEEFLAFRRRRWEREFSDAGFRVEAVLQGPVASGYGFGWNRIRRGLEWMGIASENIFVAVQQDHQSPCIDYFLGDRGKDEL